VARTPLKAGEAVPPAVIGPRAATNYGSHIKIFALCLFCADEPAFKAQAADFAHVFIWYDF
jgi:hypothetical protein